MVDARTVNDRSVIESMRETIGMKINVFATFIPASVRVTEANMEGKSIFAYDGKCKVADAYKNLTKEVLDIAPTDKGKAYKMKLEAIKRQQGERTDLTSAPLVQKLNGKSSRELLAEASDDSHEQIRRYIRLTYLVPELQEFVDKGQMKMRPAVELSYLDEETQRDIVDRIDETEAFPSHDQAIRIRKAYEAGEIDYDKVRNIMAEEKPNQKPKFKFSLRCASANSSS